MPSTISPFGTPFTPNYAAECPDFESEFERIIAGFNNGVVANPEEASCPQMPDESPLEKGPLAEIQNAALEAEPPVGPESLSGIVNILKAMTISADLHDLGKGLWRGQPLEIAKNAISLLEEGLDSMDPVERMRQTMEIEKQFTPRPSLV